MSLKLKRLLMFKNKKLARVTPGSKMEFDAQLGSTEAQILYQFIITLIPRQVTIGQYGIAPASLVADPCHGLPGQIGITRTDICVERYKPFLIDICSTPETNDSVPQIGIPGDLRGQ